MFCSEVIACYTTMKRKRKILLKICNSFSGDHRRDIGESFAPVTSLNRLQTDQQNEKTLTTRCHAIVFGLLLVSCQFSRCDLGNVLQAPSAMSKAQNDVLPISSRFNYYSSVLRFPSIKLKQICTQD